MTPSLPPEIMKHILSYAIPPPSRTSAPERKPLLRALSLVNKNWHPFAQAHLIREVDVSTETQARKLMKLFDRGVMDPLHVKTLVLALPARSRHEWGATLNMLGGVDSTRKCMLKVARRMERLDILWSHTPGEGEEDVAELLRGLNDLKSARLANSKSNPQWITPVVPRLTSNVTSLSFTLVNPINYIGRLSHMPFVKQHSLPRLSHLSIHFGFVQGHELDMVATQLESLALKCENIDPALFEQFTNLKTLFLDTVCPPPSFATLLSWLPPTLTTLHIVGSHAFVEDRGQMSWIDYMEGWEPKGSSSQLEKLVLWPKEWERVKPEEEEEISSICGEHGVKLMVVSGFGSRLAMEDWDPNEF